MKTVNVHIPEADHFNRSSDSVRLSIIYQRLLKLELRERKCLHDMPLDCHCKKCFDSSLGTNQREMRT
jgi:hypothetical protein